MKYHNRYINIIIRNIMEVARAESVDDGAFVGVSRVENVLETIFRKQRLVARASTNEM